MKLLYSQLKSSSVPKAVNLCPDDARFLRLANETLQFLLLHGSFWQTEVPLRMCVYDSCITMPRFVASLNAVYSPRLQSAHSPRNMWFTMLEHFNPLDTPCSSLKFLQHGTAATFKDPCGPVILRTYVSDPSDAGKTVTYLGHDQNGTWIRTQGTDGWQDGETVVLTTDFVDTTTQFNGPPTGVVKDPTNDLLRLYSHTPTGTALTALATYEHDETVPSYQRYQVVNFGALSGQQGCGCSTTSTDGVQVTALVKREWTPIAHDRDILPIGNLAALKLAMQAMRANDDGDRATFDLLMFGDARNRRVGAIPLLNQELRNYTGDEFSGNVSLVGTARLRNKLAGFI